MKSAKECKQEYEKIRKEVIRGRKNLRRLGFRRTHRFWADLKDFVHRGLYGWCPRDSWSVDDYLCNFMGQAIREVKGCGFPFSMYTELFGCDYNFMHPKDGDSDKAAKHWDDVLEKVAQGFDAHRFLSEQMPMPKTKEYEKANKEVEEGLQLFAKHFGQFWT